MTDHTVGEDRIKSFLHGKKRADQFHDSRETRKRKQSSLPSLPWKYPVPALRRAATEKQSSLLPKDECLYLWLAGTGGPRVSYVFDIFPKNLLFNRQQIPDTQIEVEKVIGPSDGGYCLGMGCCNLGTKIFFVGGQEPENIKDPVALAFPQYSLYKYSSRAFVRDAKNPSGQSQVKDPVALAFPQYSLYKYSSRVFVRDAKNPSRQSQVPRMLSGKASPLVLSVGNSLYVLAGSPVYVVPDPAFEKYDTDKKSWSRLPTPPFLDPTCNYFEDPQYCGYAVINDEIHVSTSSSSFSFDMKANEWKTCTLFGDAGSGAKDENIKYPPPFEWMNNPNNGGVQSCRGGAPFNFDGGAVLYDGDILICIVLSEGVVVAHKLVSGKVELKDHTQRLEGLEIPTEAISACLADFGQGFLCLVVSSFEYDYAQENLKSEISITPFQVSRNEDNKLNCKVLETITRTRMSYKYSAYQIWSAASCFVLNNCMEKTSTSDPDLTEVVFGRNLESPF